MGDFQVSGRRRKGNYKVSDRERDLLAFYRDVQPYAGSASDYEREHTQLYGRDERIGPDGRHPGPGKPRFPKGSARETLHEQYSASTLGRNHKKDAYEKGLKRAQGEYDSFDYDEREYYGRYTGGLAPHHHERLTPKAEVFAEIAYNNATGRETFMQKYPVGYHSKCDHDRHYDWAEEPFDDYDYASGQLKLHETHRSFEVTDGRKDK